MSQVYGPPSYRTIKFCTCEGCSEKLSGSERTSLFKNGVMDKDSMENLVKDSKSKFVPTVSWNTVPVGGESEDEDNDSGDEVSYLLNFHSLRDDYDSDEDYMFQRLPGRTHLNVQQNLTDRVRGSSPVRPGYGNTNISGTVEAALQNANITIGPNGEIKRRDYPSRPMLLNDALIKTIYSMDWKQKWSERAKEVENRKELNPELNFKYPDILFPKFEVDLTGVPMVNDNGDVIRKEKRDNIKRQLKVIRTPVGFHNSSKTILVHISGRKHTWVALDCALVRLAKDYDYVVVVANIPQKTWGTSGFGSRSASSSRSASRSRSAMRSPSRTRGLSPNGNTDNDTFWSNGYTVREVNDVLQNLVDYCTLLMGPKKLKLTVEVVIGPTKKILVDATNAYSPDFFVIGRLGSCDTSNPKSVGSVLMMNYPVPVIFVVANKMNSFERRLRNSLITKHDEPVEAEPLSTEIFNSDISNDSSSSTDSDPDSCDSLSTASLPLPDSRKTLKVMNRLRCTYRRLVANKLLLLENDKSLSVGERKIKKLDSIINASLNFNKELDSLGTSPELLELRQTITGGIRPRVMKKKSMLDVLDAPRKPQKTVSTSVLTEEKRPYDKKKDAPRIVLNSPSPTHQASPVSSKRDSAIKFAQSVKPSDGRNVIQKVKSYDPAYTVEMNRLDRQLSSTSMTGVKSNQIVKSHPDLELRKVLSANPIDRKKKNKSKFFSFLFGGGSNSSEGSTVNSTPDSSGLPSRRNSLSNQSSEDSYNRKKGVFQRKK